MFDDILVNTKPVPKVNPHVQVHGPVEEDVDVVMYVDVDSEDFHVVHDSVVPHKRY